MSVGNIYIQIETDRGGWGRQWDKRETNSCHFISFDIRADNDYWNLVGEEKIEFKSISISLKAFSPPLTTPPSLSNNNNWTTRKILQSNICSAIESLWKGRLQVVQHQKMPFDRDFLHFYGRGSFYEKIFIFSFSIYDVIISLASLWCAMS